MSGLAKESQERGMNAETRRLQEARQQARPEIAEHIGIFYNGQRRHSRLGCSVRSLPNNGPVNSRRRETVIHGVHRQEEKNG